MIKQIKRYLKKRKQQKIDYKILSQTVIDTKSLLLRLYLYEATTIEKRKIESDIEKIYNQIKYIEINN